MALWMRIGLVLLLASAGMARQPQTEGRDRLAGIQSLETRVIDLTYAINDKLVSWPGDTRTFEAQVNASVPKNGYFTRSFWMLEHYGTHLDAPIHFPPGHTPVDQIPPERFFGPAVVVDVRPEASKNPDVQLPAKSVELWERSHGQIPRGSIVLLRTGWASFWPDARGYRGTDEKGTMHFPGFSVEAVQLLIARGVSGIGIDTLSVDYGPSADFAVHKLSLGAGLYQLENLADLSSLPEAGAYLVVAPIKLEGGSGGPCRVFALVPQVDAKVAQR